jgi:hypothetical protein
MQSPKHYSHAPITEALIDIQVKLPSGVKLDNLAQVYSSIQAEYPQREEVLLFQGQMMVGASVGATVKQYLQTIESSGEIEYNSVPPKRSERVIMRAQFKGRKKPLPYIFDEE